MLKKICVILLFMFSLYSCASQKISTPTQEKTNFSASGAFIQDHGILYIRIEDRQAQMGPPSVLGGGEFRDLTTAYEWWVDANDVQRTKRAAIEWLEDGPHLVGAEGSDGNNKWWMIDITKNIRQVEYHDGRNPFDLQNLNDFLNIFARSGMNLIGAVQRKEAEQVGEVQQVPWGKVILIRETNSQTRQTITYTVRAESPNILVERVVLDKDGNLFDSYRITNWEWLDPATLSPDFWLSPPEDVPIGKNSP